jgi:hypothetical protein
MNTLRTRLISAAAAGALALTGLAVAATPAAAATPACGTHSLSASVADPEGATGHGSLVLLFRNLTKSTCTIYGYPGLDALNGSGHVIAHAKRTLNGFAGGPKSEKTITVKADDFASAIAEWMNFNPKTSGPCATSKSIAITPANTAHTVHVTIGVSVCDLQVHPTMAGADGNNEFGYAQSHWIAGSKAIAAEQNEYLAKAEADLKFDGSRYSSAISELKKIISLPITGLTPAQIKTVRKDTKDLNSFFITPGLYL